MCGVVGMEVFLLIRLFVLSVIIWDFNFFIYDDRYVGRFVIEGFVFYLVWVLINLCGLNWVVMWIG